MWPADEEIARGVISHSLPRKRDSFRGKDERSFFMSQNKRMLNTKTIVTLGLLVAMEIVLNRFLSINAWNTKIGFSFVPVVVAAILFGPVHAAIVGGLGDFIGAILFPIGAYFPGFTLTAALMGLVWGFFLHKKRTMPRILLSTFINQFFLGLVVNTYWISVLYGSPFKALFVTRLVQACVLFAVQTVVISVLVKVLPRFEKELDIEA